MQSQSVRAVVWFILLVGVIGSIFAWYIHFEEGPVNLAALFGMPALAVVSLVAIVRHARRKNPLGVPDYLQQMGVRYFERNGLCFAVLLSVEEGLPWISIYYQNRYDQPCTGTIVVKPPTGWWIARKGLVSIQQTVKAGPAAFGVVRVPWPIPARHQGKLQCLTVGATVSYPNGRGQLLRLKEGLRVGPHTERDNGWADLIVLVISLGMVSLSKAAQVRFRLPKKVMEEIPAGLAAESRQLWQLGDEVPPLNSILQDIAQSPRHQ